MNQNNIEDIALLILIGLSFCIFYANVFGRFLVYTMKLDISPNRTIVRSIAVFLYLVCSSIPYYCGMFKDHSMLLFPVALVGILRVIHHTALNLAGYKDTGDIE